jgi:hypothetical protein
MKDPILYTAETVGHVLRTGKVFEAGEYPDKAFSITPEELAEAAASFEPVPIKVEHLDTVFDGKVGRLTKLMASGKDLFGVFEVPQWLSDLFPGQPMKVSLAWSRGPKRILEASLVTNPRIKDAAFRAAFAAGLGLGPGQEGAGDDPGVMSEKAPTITPEDRTMLDRMRDFFGGGQSSDKGGGASLSDITAAFSNALKPVHDRLAALEAQSKAEDDEQKETKPTADDGAVLAAATAFTDDQITAGRVMPSERDGMIAAFTASAKAAPKDFVLFANGVLQETPALKAFKASFSGVKGHNLDGAAIKARFGVEMGSDGSLPLDPSVFPVKEGSK